MSSRMKQIPSTPMAEGRTAEIFLWEEDHVLKLYRDWCPSDWVEYESRVAHAIHAAGIPSPAPGEIVEVRGRRGLIYERVQGISMLQDLNARPWMLPRYARSLAELQAEIHSKSIPGLPGYKARLQHDIRTTEHVSEDLREKFLTELETLPEGDKVCHGDFHPGNVILTGNGPVVIDWMTACTGSPWADVARTSMILTIGAKAAGKQVNPLIRLVVGLYHRVYLNRYLALTPDTQQELPRWARIIAAARLREGIIPEQEALIKIISGDS